MGVDVVRDRLVLPRERPDGVISWEEQRPELGRAIREGWPEVGWTGDPDLSLALNKFAYAAEARADGGPAEGWEVWRHYPGDRPAELELRKRGSRLDGNDLLRLLAERDTRHIDVVGNVEKANAAHDRALDTDFDDSNDEFGDKLAHALAKDLSEPAPDGKVFAVGEAL